MAVETTYSALRGNLAAYLDRVTDDREIVFVRRRGAEDVAMVSAGELEGLLETVHLLRSPKNAERLLGALGKAVNGEGKVQSLEVFRKQHLSELESSKRSTPGK